MSKRHVSHLAQDSKSQIWFFRYKEGGKQVWRSLGTRDRREAEKLVKPKIAELEARRHGIAVVEPSTDVGPTWQEVRDCYHGNDKSQGDETWPSNPKTQTRYRLDLDRFGNFLAEIGLRPNEVTKQTIVRYVADCRSDDLSSSSIRNALTAVNRAFDSAHHAGLLPMNPVAAYDRSRLKDDGAAMNPPLNGEFERLLQEIEVRLPRYVLLVEFLHRTGCRLSEALQSRREEIIRDNRGDLRIWLNRGVKRGKPRCILLNTAEELLDQLPPRGLLFPGFPKAVANVSSRWGQFFDERTKVEEAAAEREGRAVDSWRLRRWRLHDLRHAFALNALCEGADIYDLSSHLGHKSVKTTELYLRERDRLPLSQQRSLRLWTRGRVLPSDQPEVELAPALERALREDVAERTREPGVRRRRGS